MISRKRLLDLFLGLLSGLFAYLLGLLSHVQGLLSGLFAYLLGLLGYVL